MPHRHTIARALATVFLADALEVRGMSDRAARLLGRRWRWVRLLAERICRHFTGRLPPRHAVLVQFIVVDDGFHLACDEHAIVIRDRLVVQPRMVPMGVVRSWDLDAITTTGELATWLGVSIPRLEWFADLRELNGRQPVARLRHYVYRPLVKRAGQIRLIEAPKRTLKEIQRLILSGILAHIPVHDAAHGFRAGRSIKTLAAAHVGRRVVLRMDLQEFFPSIRGSRVYALFRAAGYPERVASLLTGLVTHSTPCEVWDDLGPDCSYERLREASMTYSRRHLPQGAPTSPAIANLCAYHLDCRLTGLAATVGATYTRYADDLVISGGRDFERVVKRFSLHVAAVCIEEGFGVNHRKTRIMREGSLQHVAGIVVNERLNVRRHDYEQLKAILTNCARHGPAGQNHEQVADFRAHLRGRISFVESVHATRGERLRAIFEKIAW